MMMIIRKELEISGLQDVRSKHKQNWIDHLERMDNTRLPKQAPFYNPLERRDRWRPQETMAKCRCRNRSYSLIHGRR
jgi:hypothetical protein